MPSRKRRCVSARAWTSSLDSGRKASAPAASTASTAASTARPASLLTLPKRVLTQIFGLAAHEMGVLGVEATERYIVGERELPMTDDIRDAMYLRARLRAASGYCSIAQVLKPAAQANLIARMAVYGESGTNSLVRFIRRHGELVTDMESLSIFGGEMHRSARTRVGLLLGEVRLITRLHLCAEAKLLVGFDKLHKAALERLTSVTWLETSYGPKYMFTRPRHVWMAYQLEGEGFEADDVEDSFGRLLHIYAPRLRRLHFRAPFGIRNDPNGISSSYRSSYDEPVSVPAMPNLQHLSHSGFEPEHVAQILRAGAVTTFEGWPTRDLFAQAGMEDVVKRIDTLLVFSHDYESGALGTTDSPYLYLRPYTNLRRLRVDIMQSCSTRPLVPAGDGDTSSLAHHMANMDMPESILEHLVHVARPAEGSESKLRCVLLNSRVQRDYYGGDWGEGYDALEEMDYEHYGALEQLEGWGVRIGKMRTIDYPHLYIGAGSDGDDYGFGDEDDGYDDSAGEDEDD